MDEPDLSLSPKKVYVQIAQNESLENYQKKFSDSFSMAGVVPNTVSKDVVAEASTKLNPLAKPFYPNFEMRQLNYDLMDCCDDFDISIFDRTPEIINNVTPNISVCSSLSSRDSDLKNVQATSFMV